MMFSVGYTSEKRAKEIASLARKDHTTAVILAAVHFEWMIKRTVLMLSCSPTKHLRAVLEDIYSLKGKAGADDYKSVWDREVASRFKNSKLGTVLGNLHVLQEETIKVRGRVIHGNGTVSKSEGKSAVDEFLKASIKLRDFASKHGCNIDERLKARLKSRES